MVDRLGLITGRFRRRASGHFAGLDLLREDDANSFGVESAGKWLDRRSDDGAVAPRQDDLPGPAQGRLDHRSRHAGLDRSLGGDLDGWLEALGSE
jgi:hypothetical protein